MLQVLLVTKYAKRKAQKKNVFFSIAVRDSLTIIRTIK